MSVIYNAKVLPQVKDEEPKSKILVNFGLLSGKEVFEVELSEQATVVELREKVVSQLGYTKGSPFEEFQPAFDWKRKDGTELHGHEVLSQLEEFYVEEKRQEMVSAVVSHCKTRQHHGSDSCKLDKVPTWMRDDKEVIMAAMQLSPRHLGYASKRLRDDKEVVLSALEIDGQLLGHASKKLRNDRDVVLAAVRKCGWTLAYASENLQNDHEMIQAAAAAGQSESGIPDCPLVRLLVP